MSTVKQNTGRQAPDASQYVTLTDGAGNLVTISGGPSTGLTDTELRATPVPVSGTVTASGPVTDTQLRATPVPVSGTFYQATQPVSGTFYQATQPVSLVSTVHVDDNSSTLSIDDGGGSITVDGAFYQATQPVSGTFYQATQPVSGDFYPVTQPVSLASVVQVGDNSSTLSVDDGGGSLTVDGVFYQSTQPVSLSTLPTLTNVTTLGTITNVVHVDDNATTLSVDDGGGTLTVDGSVTVSGTVTASGPLTDTELRASAVPVSVATIPSHAVTNAGTFAVQVATLPLPSGAATDTLQTSGNSSLSSIAASVSGILSSQGASSSSALGVLSEAVVSEVPQNYLPDYIQPLSITSEGRLRVSSTVADIQHVWNTTFDDPYQSQNLYSTENVSYV